MILRVLCRLCSALPVLFVLAIIAMDLYSYFILHGASLLSCAFTLIVGLILWAYFQTITTDSSVAGNPPREPVPDTNWCHKCTASKPERAHHCSLCGTCVLKMDHHCPWVNNCVGVNNYKFFVLFLVYALVGCFFFLLTSWDSLRFAFGRSSASQYSGFCVVFSTVLTSAFALALTGFAFFHMYLVLIGSTTLEYGYINKYGNPFDLGWRKNFTSVFGESAWYWCVPVHRHRGRDNNGWQWEIEAQEKERRDNNADLEMDSVASETEMLRNV